MRERSGAQHPGPDVDFAELFTDSARQLLPMAHGKGLVSHLDYQGPYVELAGDTAGIRGGLHRIMTALVELVDQGFVMFHAEVTRVDTDDACLVTVHAAAAGRHAVASRVVETLERLRLETAREPLEDLPAGHPSRASVRAVGRCESSGADVTFSLLPDEGLVFSWRLRCGPECPCTEHAAPRAEGAPVWLVDTVPSSLHSVQRRMGQAGWQIDRLESLACVAPLLRARVPDAPALLLIVFEAGPNDLASLEAISRQPAPPRLVLAVLAGSPSLQSRDTSPVDIRVLPLSPRELDAFTRHIDPATSTPLSRSTSPAPRYHADRNLALVADDNRFNQLVARGMLEVLGYRVAVVADGAEAIASCLADAPDVVLMDLDMPVMDGFEATLRIRAMQRDGALPPFVIVAATALRSVDAEGACLAAGMDGFLEKPLGHPALAGELCRLVPSRPVEHSTSAEAGSRAARAPS